MRPAIVVGALALVLAACGSSGQATKTVGTSGAASPASTQRANVATALPVTATVAPATATSAPTPTPPPAGAASATTAPPPATVVGDTASPGAIPAVSILPANPQDLPNFTLTQTATFQGLPVASRPDTGKGTPTPATSQVDTGGRGSMSVQIEQTSPDNYHIQRHWSQPLADLKARMEATMTAMPSTGITQDGLSTMEAFASDTTMEAWLVDGTFYANFLGNSPGITAYPAEAGANLGWTPASSVADEVPIVAELPGTRRIGTETIEGRAATHYHLDGTDYLAAASQDARLVLGAHAQGSELTALAQVTNVHGGVDYWIDAQLQFQLKATINVTWTNADGSPGSFVSDLAITHIGDTPPVSAPQ